jgi:isoquinoline 1-oxidoreductase subunit beta
MNRRDFITVCALAAGGLVVAITLPFRRSIAQPNETASLNSFLKIGTDNTIHIILNKVEVGQGISTTLPILMAEELDCSLDSIQIYPSPPGEEKDFLTSLTSNFTGGSLTTVTEFERYRMAGATARKMIIQAAARQWNVAEEKCSTKDRYVICGDHRGSYGSFALAAARLPVPEATLRHRSEWRYIGKSQRRLDNHLKVNGKAEYGIDIHFDGLCSAVVLHPPVFGATIRSFDAVNAKKIEGVKGIYKVSTGIGIVADNFWAATKAKHALADIQWDVPDNNKINSVELTQIYRELGRTQGRTIAEKGNVKKALEKKEKLTLDYLVPFLAHAPMEPLNCTVKISEDTCEVWAATQSPWLHQAEIAHFLGIPAHRVQLYTPMIGGSFGRRGSFSKDWVMEAVELAKVSGFPLKLIWTREDDITGGYYRPMYHHHVEIALNDNMYPSAWLHRIVGQSLFVNTPLEQEIVVGGIDWSCATTGQPYSTSVDHYSFELHTPSLPVPVLAWRSVGSTHNAFVIESLVDELSHIAREDPLTYRQRWLKEAPRYLRVLNEATAKAGWGSVKNEGHYQGLAVCDAMGSYLCQVVEISIDQELKKLIVHKVVCAIDCGLAVNPDGVKAQMEGGIIFGLTAALYGEVTLKDGQVEQSNFHDYRMLRITQCPVIEVHIVESNEKMGGAGEPGVAPIAAALTNAIFAATGKRIRTLPIYNSDLFA